MLKQMFDEYNGKIMTLTGLVPASDIGVMLPHEHLFILHQGPEIDLDDVGVVIEEIKAFKALGGTAVVDQTNEHIGRNPAALLRIARETGLHILMGSGYYKDAYIPERFDAMTEDDVAAEIYGDIVGGIDVGGTRVHAGHIGEIGVSRCITERELRSIRGAARAQKATGAAITVHFDLDAQEPEHNCILGILKEEGVDLRRVVFCHVVPKIDNIERILRLAGQGVNISFEFGVEVDQRMEELIDTTLEERLVSIKEMLRLGLIDRLMISQDVCFQACLTKNGGYGYVHILKNIVPWFRRLKINEYDIQRLICNNPRKVFSFYGGFPSY